MNDTEQMSVLLEIRDLLRQNLELHQAETAEHRQQATVMHESGQRALQVAFADQRSAMRWHSIMLAAIVTVGFIVATLELKVSISEQMAQQETLPDGQAIPEDVVKRLFPSEQDEPANEPPQKPSLDSI